MNLVYFADDEQIDALSTEEASASDETSEQDGTRDSSNHIVFENAAAAQSPEILAEMTLIRDTSGELLGVDEVFKIGAVTGFTTGIFYGFYRGDSYNNRLLCVVIEWKEGGRERFGSDGDCGSIYFYNQNGLKIPFAVHIASAKLACGKIVSLGAPLRQLQLEGYYFRYCIDFHKNVVQFQHAEVHHEVLTGTPHHKCDFPP
jgi:hypothetical protein